MPDYIYIYILISYRETDMFVTICVRCGMCMMVPMFLLLVIMVLLCILSVLIPRKFFM